jgi:HEAT repeat protein
MTAQLLAGLDDERARARLRAATDDQDPGVAALSAAALAGDPVFADRLRSLAADPDPSVRAVTVRALPIAPSAVAVPIAATAIDDEAPAVRAAALGALAAVDRDAARPPAIALLHDPSAMVRRAAAGAAAVIADGTVPALLEAVGTPVTRDAALDALTHVDLGEHRSEVDALAGDLILRATEDRDLADAIVGEDDATTLLREAVLARGRANARTALRALSLTSDDGASLRAAVENLGARDGAQAATALETLESTSAQTLVRPLIPLWDRAEVRHHDGSLDAIARAAEDPDPFIALCGELVRTDHPGGHTMDVHTTMPAIERVLFLRKVPLFDELDPADLLPIAEVADEQVFADGDRLGAEGEMGDGMHVIVIGAVHVRAGGETIAERGPGDVVGELSLITARPRMADLIADGDVRTIWITRRAFEGMVHDRPDVAIGVMRVLATRLAEHAPEAAPRGPHA